MYCFESREDIKNVTDDYHPTTDLDVFADSLGTDVKIIFSAQHLIRVLAMPEGDKLFMHVLREIVGEENEGTASIRENPYYAYVLDSISDRIGVFGIWTEGKEDD